jgi:flagellar motor switch protein FliN/FliY
MSGDERNDTIPAPQDAASATATADDAATAAESLGVDLGESQNLDLLMDVDMKLTVELGRARLKFRDVLNLTTGSVVELAKLTSEPVDIMVNGALLATGEVVVAEDHFAVRITKLLNRVERLKRVL